MDSTNARLNCWFNVSAIGTTIPCIKHKRGLSLKDSKTSGWKYEHTDVTCLPVGVKYGYIYNVECKIDCSCISRRDWEVTSRKQKGSVSRGSYTSATLNTTTSAQPKPTCCVFNDRESRTFLHKWVISKANIMLDK